MAKSPLLRILSYHSINDSYNFDKQIKFLRKNFSIISYYQLTVFLKNRCLPEKPLLITSDDGDKSFYDNAFPILKNHELSATLFVITNLIGTSTPFWWNEIEYYLGKNEGNKKVLEVKCWANKRREAYLEELRNTSSKPILKYDQLTPGQLREMQEAGITIANHSHTHPMFDKCTPEELEHEMSKSTIILRDLGFTPDVFAYPNGNFSPNAESILQKYGIKQAYLFDHKINKGDVNPLRISRLVVNDTTPLWKFKLILSGWHTKILPITKALGKLRK
ncbi:polysaccharide deacetylase family protein [Salegentibacter flavus]|uniref:Polysaccharide deacetylase n=1 Tax=Salegentibacter flavus TaxID=287099 RepID=A0A1I5BGW9_9FLAO|nr:polysaccharide deacetylase family protein [Salegentibacter flavus]SFN73731.1 Polysaccharide deacetylase [Salegentibacter flavus]